MPRLDLQARKNLGTSNDGRNSTNAADVLELTANFNLFNGFSDKAAVGQAIEKMNTANDMRDKACVDTRQLVTIAYNDIMQLKAPLGYRDTHQKSIENAREAYRKQFDIGQRTLLDLLDPRERVFSGQTQLRQYRLRYSNCLCTAVCSARRSIKQSRGAAPRLARFESRRLS